MKAVKWFSKAMTLGFVFFMALLLVNPENSLEFVAMIPFGAFAAYLLTESCNADYYPPNNRKEMCHTKLFFIGLIGGSVMSYGAFLAQGIGEGNIVSGLLLGSISSYAFVIAALLTAIPVAILLKEYSEGGE